MPHPFRPLSVSQFRDEIARFAWSRRVWRVDLHHSVVPSVDDYDGLASIEQIWRNDIERRGWEDIAQHVTVAPDGLIWTGRDWNRTPASIGRRMNLGAFMVEAIGNFDRGRDRLEGRQLDSLLAVIDTVQRKFALPVHALLFHRDVPQADDTSPGSSIEKHVILKRVLDLRATAPATTRLR
ncbi:MAG: peptidoglycan recognition protein family protein [Hyphomicrobium sp.]